MFKKQTIDSFRILIPFNLCEVVNSTFLQEYVHVYLSSGEIEMEEEEEVKFKNNSIARKRDGVSIKIAYCKVKQKDSTTGKFLSDGKEYILILINAKQAQKDYFEGVSNKTIKTIYDYIIAQNIVNFSFDDLLNNETIIYNDIDICTNVLMPEKEYEKLLNSIKGNVILEKQYLFKRFKTNGGVQFNDRNKNPTATKPFCKIYHKSLELKTKSFEFYNKFLNPLPIPPDLIIVRFEVNVKDAKMKKYYNLKFRNLQGLFNYIESTNEPIVTKLFSNYFQKKKRMSKDESILATPTEVVLHEWAILLFKCKQSEEAIIHSTTQKIIDRKRKYKVKEVMRKTFDSVRETNDGAELINKANEANKYLDSAYKLVGIYED